MNSVPYIDVACFSQEFDDWDASTCFQTEYRSLSVPRKHYICGSTSAIELSHVAMSSVNTKTCLGAMTKGRCIAVTP